MTSARAKYDGWRAWLVVAAISVVNLGLSLWWDEGINRYLGAGCAALLTVLAVLASYRAHRLDQVSERSALDEVG